MGRIRDVKSVELHAHRHPLADSLGLRQRDVGIVVAGAVHLTGSRIAQLQWPGRGEATGVEPFRDGAEGAHRGAGDVGAIRYTTAQVVEGRIEREWVAGLQLGDGAQLPAPEQRSCVAGRVGEPARRLRRCT